MHFYPATNIFRDNHLNPHTFSQTHIKPTPKKDLQFNKHKNVHGTIKTKELLPTENSESIFIKMFEARVYDLEREYKGKVKGTINLQVANARGDNDS